MHELFGTLADSRRPNLDRGDKRLMWALTLIYTVFTLINLGSLSFPQSQWTAPDDREIILDFGEVREIKQIRYNGGIGEGVIRYTGDDGAIGQYYQQYGNMYRWETQDIYLKTRYLRLEKSSGDVVMNEIAFFDQDGNLLPVTVSSGDGEGLVDEQDTVPESPSYMDGMYFDEIYHARTAFEFLHCMNVYEWTHPPLGKIFIALGIAIFGMTPFGWRIVPALFGAAMLPEMFILGKRLFRRRDFAFLASALFALDTMHYAQTRIATVDVFIVFFILLMYLFMYDYLQVDFYEEPLKKAFRPLGACGIAFGLGVCSKWTGLYAGVGLAVLFFSNLIRNGLSARGNAEKNRVFWRRMVLTGFFCCCFFLLIPAILYVLSYIPFYLYEMKKTPGIVFTIFSALRLVIDQQKGMYSYHSKLTATHLCQTTWYEWPFATKAVWFYSNTNNDTASNISTIGSPAVWWVSSVGTVCLALEALTGRLRRAPGAKKCACLVILIGVMANYVPWVTVPRCTFLYHFFPTLPFTLLSALMLLQHLEEERELSPQIKWIWLGVATVYFILMLPAVSGIPTSIAYARFVENVLPTGLIYYGTV